MKVSRRLRLLGDLRTALAGPRLSRERIEAFRARRLREIVEHAYRTVPFYRRLYNAHGVRADDVRGVEDLARLPIIDKQALRAVPEEDLISSEYRRDALAAYRTSGSTGIPMRFFRSWAEARLTDLIRRRMAYEHGVTARSRLLQLAARPGGNDDGALQRIGRRLGWFPTQWQDPLVDPDEVFAALERTQPDVLRGMTSIIDRMVQAKGPEAFERIRTERVMVGGDRLTEPMRRRLEQAFPAAVVDVYGTFEFNLMAQQCTRGRRLHVLEHSVVLEVLADGRPAAAGEPGEVVATGLHSWAMPLIRYRQGDLAVRGPDGCACGTAFGSIESIEGRSADVVKLRDGRRLHVLEMIDPWWSRYDDWVERYQVVQETETEICLLVEPSRGPTRDELEEIRSATQGLLGEAATARVEVVERIPPLPSGKYRLAVSCVEDRVEP